MNVDHHHQIKAHSQHFVKRLLVFLCLPVLPAAAQSTASAYNPTKAEDLGDVVVTATRSERATADIPASVIAISQERIQATTLLSLKDALSGQPGVLSETRNGGYDSRLIIRGSGLKATYGVREIMVLLDGVPITDPDGMSRFDFIDTQLVDRIDVVKGPNSTLYGANAAGGVVNIITKSPFESVSSIKAGYGDHNTQGYNGIASTNFGQTYVTATASYKSTDGWRQWNKFDTEQGSLRFAHRFAKDTTVEGSVSYTEANIQLPGALTKEQFDQDISQLTREAWKKSGRYSHILNTNVRIRHTIGDWSISPLLYFQHWNHYHPVTGIINRAATDAYGTELQAQLNHQLAGAPAELVIGISGQANRLPSGKKYKYQDVATVNGRITSTLSDIAGDLAETDNDTTSKVGIYAQESLHLGSRWIIDTGIRLDRVNFELNHNIVSSYNYSSGRYVNSPSNISVDKKFDYASPRIGVVYKLKPNQSLYGNISTGFQTPQSSELTVNPSLKPATTVNEEVGYKFRSLKGHSIDVALFNADVRNEVVQTYLPGGESSYNRACPKFAGLR